MTEWRDREGYYNEDRQTAPAVTQHAVRQGFENALAADRRLEFVLRMVAEKAGITGDDFERLMKQGHRAQQETRREEQSSGQGRGGV